MTSLKTILLSLVLAGCALGVAFALISRTGSSAVFGASQEVSGTNTVGPPRLLSVPYVSQGATDYCFETSLDMVLWYWGKTVSLQDVVRASGHNGTTGDSLFDLFAGWVHPYLSQWSNLSYSHDIWGWDFNHYRAEIDRGKPVIATSFGLPGHTIVVVGYSFENGDRYLYVNDPSGFLSETRWQTGAVEYAKVSWEHFSKLRWTELTIGPS